MSVEFSWQAQGQAHIECLSREHPYHLCEGLRLKLTRLPDEERKKKALALLQEVCTALGVKLHENWQ